MRLDGLGNRDLGASASGQEGCAGMVWCSPERHGQITGLMKAQIDHLWSGFLTLKKGASTSNLYVVGSSVFATGGGMPPTLLVTLLALRLADHLAARAAMPVMAAAE